jgi:hypothetical protein
MKSHEVIARKNAIEQFKRSIAASEEAIARLQLGLRDGDVSDARRVHDFGRVAQEALIQADDQLVRVLLYAADREMGGSEE